MRDWHKEVLDAKKVDDIIKFLKTAEPTENSSSTYNWLVIFGRKLVEQAEKKGVNLNSLILME